ncbi:MAG: DUF6352 family protein [Xanthobacteraceae bacterium]|nr:hypothetical protein [Burkholderiales bacterium]MCZ7658096.1 DUF6352 family protein [Xanthobacteraceae bacterium]PWB59449.1 MAG: hypothetical protein C3F17_16800 [Bradyrhizobiaceae bacterium]
MTDFWLSCGHHLLDRDSGGGLVVTDEFLKVYFARPELAPPPDAGVLERTLHATLLADPRRPVAAQEIAALEDADARENWELMIGFRDHLLRHATLEGAYAALIRGGARTPILFLNQLVHVILRNVLDGCEDPYVLRAAEIMFRPQLVTLHEGSLLAADEETIADHTGHQVSPLVSMMGLPAEAEIDVMTDENAASYWERSDRFDMALDLSGGQRGHAALGEVIAGFVRHMLGVDVDVEPIVEARDVQLAWYVGLDQDGTKIGDLLWNGEPPDEATARRIAALYRLTFRDPAVMIQKVAGEPVYLILAMTADKRLRLKPQNLVTGLPVRHLEAVS